MDCCLPIAGGNWFRQLPHTLLKKAVKNWDEKFADPFVMHYHIWELDPKQPRIQATDRLSKIRHYQNLDKIQWFLEDYLSKYRFGSVADSFSQERQRKLPDSSRQPTNSGSPTCFIKQQRRSLDKLESELSDR
jgi:hypothetical protein